MPKISQLPTLETITTGSIIPVVENSITQKLSVGKLYEFLSGTLDQTFATEIELMLSASSLVTTSSFNAYTASANTSSLVTTSSFNSYTSSNDGKWNTLGGQTGSFVTEAETGSFVTNVSMFLSKSAFDTYTGSAANAVSSAINTATSSLSSSNAALDNIQLFTSSFNTFTSSVNSTTQSLNNFTASVIATGSNINSFTASVNGKTGSYATTGSNIFIGTQTITGSLNVSGNTVLSGSLTITGSIVGANNLVTTSSFNAYTASVVSVNTSSLATTASLNSYTSSNDGKWNTLGGQTGSFVTTSSFNSFSSSINTTTASLNTFSASVIATGSLINTFTASVNGKTGSFATTGSNTFIGNQTISGSLNITSTGSVQPSIGDSLEGGKVAYILTSSDAGYDPTLIKGIIVATTDQSTGIQWYNGAFTTTSATGTAIGTGLSNTDAIIASQGAVTTNYAAGLARAYGGGGYSDWFLPSKDELNQLYLNRVAIGGFASAFYWSSTEATQFFTWRQNLNTGVQDTLGKSGLMYVRAIRTFSIPALTVVALGSNTTISGSLTITGSVNISGSTNITQYLTVGGNIINSSTATSLTLDGENVTVTGDLSVGGNDIKSNIGTTAITLSGSSVSMPGPVTITGSLNVSGSLIVTGSARGNVVPITIVSSTASLDMTSGSYFTLTLANTTNTHIRATSITPGISATLLITTGTNSSASLSPLLLQPSGSSYTASLGSGKKDVLSLVAFDSTNMYVVSTKAMQ